MQDHKTVREALEYLRDWQPKDGADVVVETATEALAAIDRIEDVETVTVQDFEDVIENATAEEVMEMYPNGLRIVKEK